MGIKTLLLFFILLAIGNNSNAYKPNTKENILTDVLLSEILNRMDRELDGVNYYEMDSELPKNVDLVARSSQHAMPEEFDYRQMFAGVGGTTGSSGSGIGVDASAGAVTGPAAAAAAHPAIRDQELLQHSSLWGHQYVSGGMGEVPNRYNTIVKTDATLPAYCNPPNPCPYGYEENQGCITVFENTAIFSREFQAAQDCTCDNEHMFDCASQESSANTNEMTTTMEKFLMHQFQNENGLDNSNAVVKKFYGFNKNNKLGNNPFLQGEKLPIAAKKGDRI